MNGKWNALTLPTGMISANVNSITVSGTDLYVAGDVSGTSGGSAGYWKNGSWTALAPNAVGYSIVIAGTKVYVAGVAEGSDGYIPGYWENGTWVGLAPASGANTAWANTIVLQ
jgi:hypothetical protein